MDIFLSFFEVATEALITALVFALVRHMVTRKKEGTAPISSRDGSDGFK